MYRGRLWTMRQYAGFGTASESNARYQLPVEPGGFRPECRLRPADTDGLRLRSCARRRRSRPRRRRHRLGRGHGGAIRQHPAWPCFDVDDDQRDGGDPAVTLCCRREATRCRAREALRHDPERHPEGIHRPRDLYLSAARIAPDRHGHLRLLRALAPQLEHHLDQRISHPGGRFDGSPGSRVHAGGRDRLCAGGDRRRP